MKQFILLLFFLFSFSFFVYPRDYYACVGYGLVNGSVTCFNDGPKRFDIASSYLIDYSKGENARTSQFKYIDENGNRVYETWVNMPTIWGKYEYTKFCEYRVAPDYSCFNELSYSHGSVFYVSVFVNNRADRDRFYEQNKDKQSAGMNFNPYDFGSSGFSSGSNSGDSRGRNSYNSAANCSYCRGTGVMLSPSSGGGRASHVAYYNSAGTQCPYCSYTNQHYHYKCLH